MTRFFYCFIFLLACSCFGKLQAVVDSPNALVNGVELCDKPLYDVEHHYYGGDLTVVNYNPYSVYASVELIKKVNVRTNVKNDIIVVGPYDKAYVGRVQQVDPNKAWSYHAQLYAIPVN